jgi:hypothetical protein
MMRRYQGLHSDLTQLIKHIKEELSNRTWEFIHWFDIKQL